MPRSHRTQCTYTLYSQDVSTIMHVIPPVASTAGEGGKPPGGECLRAFPVYLLSTGSSV